MKDACTQNIDCSGKVTLKWILQEHTVKMQIGMNSSGHVQTGIYGKSNELSDSIETRNCLACGPKTKYSYCGVGDLIFRIIFSSRIPNRGSYLHCCFNFNKNNVSYKICQCGYDRPSHKFSHKYPQQLVIYNHQIKIILRSTGRPVHCRGVTIYGNSRTNVFVILT